MPQDPDYDDLVQPLAEIITRFLGGDCDYPEFQRQFQPVLKSYERSIKDRAYWPLDVIADIPKHCKCREFQGTSQSTAPVLLMVNENALD